MTIAQFVGDSKAKAMVKVNKNHNLRTAYNIEFVDSDGYESDYTNNSEGTFKFVANSTMFDTTDNDSNGESVIEGTKFNVNAAMGGHPVQITHIEIFISLMYVYVSNLLIVSFLTLCLLLSGDFYLLHYV